MGVNSEIGRLVVFVGFFAFVGILFAFARVGDIAQKEYRRGLTRMNPLGCTAVAFIFLVLVPLTRSCAGA